MKKKRMSLGLKILIIFDVLLVIFLCAKALIRNDLAVADEVTFRYIADEATYAKGGYQKEPAHIYPRDIKWLLELKEEMDRPGLRSRSRSAEPTSFPCYIVEFKLRGSTRCLISVTQKESLIYEWPFGTRSTAYSQENPWYQWFESSMNDMTAR